MKKYKSSITLATKLLSVTLAVKLLSLERERERKGVIDENQKEKA